MTAERSGNTRSWSYHFSNAVREVFKYWDEVI